MKSILIATAFCVVALPAPAGAQSSSRFTGGVELGAARTWDDESFIGTGLVTGLRLGYDLTDRTTIDVGVTRIAHHRQFPQSPVEAEGRSLLTNATLTFAFRRSGVSPYVLAGYGLNQHDRTWTESDATSRSYSSLTHGYTAGAGIRFRRGRLEMGPEARITMLATDTDTGASIIIAGVWRAGWRF